MGDSASYSAFKKVKAEGRCRLCETPGYQTPWPPGDEDELEHEPDWENPRPKLTKHHLVPHSWFWGPPAKGQTKKRPLQPPEIMALCEHPDNVVGLCRRCHDAVEHSIHVRAALRAKLLAAELAMIERLVGRVWLDLRYPVRWGEPPLERQAVC